MILTNFDMKQKSGGAPSL